MTSALEAFAWPLSQLDEAVELLARRIGHGGRLAAAATLEGLNPDDAAALGRGIERLVLAQGLEVQPYALRYAEIDALPAPIILKIPGEIAAVAASTDGGSREPAFVIAARRRGRTLVALRRDRRWQRFDGDVPARVFRDAAAKDHVRELEQLLETSAVAIERRPHVLRALLAEQLGDADVADAWRIVAEPGADFGRRLRRAGIRRGALGLAALHAIQFVFWLVSWTLIGRGALEDRTDWGWMTAWVLLLATVVPLQSWAMWLQGTLALDVGRLLKERLLVGALRLDPEAIRHQGVGQLLARVLESEAVESLAIGGGIQAALAAIELVLAAAVLWLGTAGGQLLILLTACIALATMAALAYHRQKMTWAAARLDMTNQLVEHVAGHRTRLAQEHPDRWHVEEDRRLEDYVARSTELDRWAPALLVAIPRGWLLGAVALVAPGFVTGANVSALAVALGGVLLATLALRRFAEGLSQLSGAATAWREAEPLFDAARHRPAEPSESTEPTRTDGRGGTLEIRDVTFQYPGRPAPVLVGCSLFAATGDRLLLQGRSGGGKSTFASIVAGLRSPGTGLVLVDGLDRRTLGAHGWRRRVVAAPQFHENHVFCETFAFNLLMGRRWPPTEDDLDEALATARALGLGDLLDRMPAGLMQLVGEGGWQLSHGERGRLFMARALLQGGDVMILDESFAALDPETLRQTLDCVFERAPTLLVIAHP
jgi:ATP-binding cassette subfamily B protein